jgi:ABC-type multidrug transport system fused ATPase/permease subunit
MPPNARPKQLSSRSDDWDGHPDVDDLLGQAPSKTALIKYIPRTLPYLRPYKLQAIYAVILTALAAVVPLLTPWPLKILVDNVLGDHPLPAVLGRLLGPFADNRQGLILAVVAAGFGLALAEGGLKVLRTYVETKLDQRMVLDFRSDLFQHVQRLSLAYHDRSRKGEFMTRINHSSQAIGKIPAMLLPLAQSIVTLVGMFWVAYHIHAGLTLISLTVVPFLSYATAYYAKNIVKRVRRVRGMEGQSLSIVHEAISMLRVIIAFGREEYEYRRFRDQGETAVDARLKLTVRQTLFSMAVNASTAAGTGIVLGAGAYFVLQGQLTVGDLLVMMGYIQLVYSPLQAISSVLGSLQEQLVILQLAWELLEQEPEVKDAPDAIDVERVAGHVVFERVHFGYEGRAATLEDISFVAKPGQLIGVVGPTGAGKSTLVGLIPRFYDPTEGRILLDGTDLRTLTTRSLRRQVSLVLQEPLLFALSIADNIGYGRLEASMDGIIEAAQAANAHDFIMRLPDGYETRVGERGARLSGGERQRIAIARAFLKGSPILILDEPTSSIDSKTESVILDALQRLAVGRTTFMVAHRLSTISNADRILVLEHGRLVEQGTHDELVQRDGLYKQLWDAQAGSRRRTPERALQLQAAEGAMDRAWASSGASNS